MRPTLALNGLINCLKFVSYQKRNMAKSPNIPLSNNFNTASVWQISNENSSIYPCSQRSKNTRKRFRIACRTKRLRSTLSMGWYFSLNLKIQFTKNSVQITKIISVILNHTCFTENSTEFKALKFALKTTFVKLCCNELFSEVITKIIMKQ